MNQFTPLGPNEDKFTPELRILVASLLSMVVILLWAKFFAPKPPARPQPQNTPAVSATATPGTPATSAATGASSPSTSASTTVSAANTTATPAIGDSQERTIVVENALYRVEFSNRGAVVKSWQLKKYKDDAKPRRTLDLVHPASAEQTSGWPLSMVFDDPQLEKAANTALYTVSGDRASLSAPADLTFTWSDGHLEVTKKFHFDHSYVVNVETAADYNGSHVMAGLAWRGGFGDETVTDPSPETTINTFYSENGKLSMFLA